MGREAVTIAGAGLAGLTAAIGLADRGLRVTVLERRSEAGVRHRGDWQGIENWTTEADVLDEIAGLGLKPDFEHWPCHEMILFDPRGREYPCRAGRPMFHLVRRGATAGSLDRWLVGKAEQRGVEIRYGCSARASESPAISARGPDRANVIAAGQVFDTDMADGAYAMLSNELAPWGYAYLLIRNGRGTVATCMFTGFGHSRTYLARTVERFHDLVGLHMSDPRDFHGFGCLAPAASACRDGVLYVGEDAGFQDGLWGFGMRFALRSGAMAARCVAADEPLSYDRLWRRSFAGQFRTAAVNRFVYERVGHLGYTRLIQSVTAAADPRRWLRRYYGRSLVKDLCFPLVHRWPGAGRRQVGPGRLSTAECSNRSHSSGR